jgi:FKBP-type peptidyl-prolyl cis-trans isomerase 2
VLLKLMGTPAGGGEPVQADNMLCHLGGEETLESFTENLRGANPGETKQFESRYPDDYPDPKLAGKTYNYSVDVQGIKEKKLPELNDEFAKDAAGEQGGVNPGRACARRFARTWMRRASRSRRHRPAKRSSGANS